LKTGLMVTRKNPQRNAKVISGLIHYIS